VAPSPLRASDRFWSGHTLIATPALLRSSGELGLCLTPLFDVARLASAVDVVTTKSPHVTSSLASCFLAFSLSFSVSVSASVSVSVSLLSLTHSLSPSGQLCRFGLKSVPLKNDNEFPVAHTCFNRIDMPLYRTKEQLRAKLQYVLQSDVSGFGIE
jgi:hypothetical protein